MAQAVQEIPLAAEAAPEALQLTDGREFDSVAGPLLAELQRLLAVEYPPTPGRLPTILTLTNLGCLASAVMDIFAQHIDEIDAMHFWAPSLARGSSPAHQRRKALRALKLRFQKAHNALPGARGAVCRSANRSIIQRRGTRRGLLNRIRRLGRRRSTRRVRA